MPPRSIGSGSVGEAGGTWTARRQAVTIGLLVAATVVAYHNSFSGPFIFDDPPAIIENQTIRSFGTALFPPGNSGLTVSGRPILNLSLALNWAISGKEVWSYHAINLALHVSAGLVLFGLVRRTLALPAQRERCADDAWWLAPAIAGVWLVHPLQTESVTYIVQRAESLVGLCYLLTLYGFVRGVEAAGSSPATAVPPRSRPAAVPSKGPTGNTTARRWFAVAFVACVLGMASKEVMVSAPLLVLLYDRTFVAGTFRAAWRARRRVYLALATTWLLLAWLVWTTGSRGRTAGFSAGTSVWHYLLTQCEALLLYLKLSLWPDPLVLDYGIGVVTDPAAVWWQASVLLALLAGTVIALIRRPVLGFLGAWFFAILAPTSSFVPIATHTIAEHRMYLPLAALVVLGVCGARQLAGRRALVVVVPVALVFLALTIRRNQDYRTAASIWTDTITKRPDNGRVMGAMGMIHQEAGRRDEARAAYERALALGPPHGSVHGSLATILLELGQLGDALAHFEVALQLLPDDSRVHSNYGNALLQAGQPDRAIEHQRRAIELDATVPDVHYNLANTLAALGRFDEAVPAFRAAVRLKPDFVEARFNLANALAMLGRLDEAIAEFRTVLAARPDFAEGWTVLGHALAQSGRFADARAAYESALRAGPSHAGARAALEHLRRSATP